MKLNVEQRRLVELEPQGHLAVKGVAGSGKTSVAIRRLSFLKENYCFEPDDKILLVTFNKTLLHFINYHYDKLSEAGTYASLLATNEKNTTITNIDKLMFQSFRKRSNRRNARYQLAEPVQKRLQVMNQAIQQLMTAFPDVALLKPKYSRFLLDEISWIKACDIEALEAYQTIDRLGRSSGASGMPQKIIKNSSTREAIYRLMERYDQLLLDEDLIDFQTMNIMALKEVEETDTESYTHIIVDESQDLTKTQLLFLRAIHRDKPYGSFMFVADNTQSIYANSWLGKGRSYASIGYDMSGRTRTLSKNYRTTTEISKAAYGLIAHDEAIMSNVDFVKPALIDRHGHAPIYRLFKNHADHLAFLTDEITKLQNDYALKDICIVAKENRLLEDIEQHLTKADIPAHQLKVAAPDFDREAIKCLTMHSIKGLEFKVILLVHLDEGVLPNLKQVDQEDEATVATEERKLLYVGMTRANDLLYMTSVKKPSRFLREINVDHLRMLRDQKLHPYQTVPIPEYRLTDQVNDLNGKEEKVRQWLIKELVETYHYPDTLIALEYPVQQFSKRGYVDLAVSIYKENEKQPYFFVETKALGSGLKEAKAQLTSYLQADTQVRYGIVTDGLELLIFDKQGDYVTDIPPCQPQFLPQTEHQNIYHNFRNQKDYRYLADKDDARQVTVIDQASELVLDETLERVPVIGDVAAGVPIAATQHFEDSVYLPRGFIIRQAETFALTVKGDSMINIGIDKGDIVIVHRQQTADAGDVVIALIDGEATMKTYRPMGSDILLQSENYNYEPIIMHASDIEINGKVIGVLKNNVV